MFAPNPNQQPTPLSKRILYFLMVVAFYVAPLFLLIFGGLFLLFDSDLTPSPYGGNPVYKIDYEFCLEIRPAEELKVLTVSAQSKHHLRKFSFQDCKIKSHLMLSVHY